MHDRCAYLAGQNEQWCRAEKSVSGYGSGGTSDCISGRLPPPEAAQGTAADAGLPLAAKAAQAVRMLAAMAPAVARVAAASAVQQATTSAARHVHAGFMVVTSSRTCRVPWG